MTAQRVAEIALRRRSVLLRASRSWLPWEDLEDCFGQAVLELLQRLQRQDLLTDAHVSHALDQKFRSRVLDVRRARSGRSARALEAAAPSIDNVAQAACCLTTTEDLVLMRDALRRGLDILTPAQRAGLRAAGSCGVKRRQRARHRLRKALA